MAKPNFMVKFKPKVGINDLNNGNDNAAYVMWVRQLLRSSWLIRIGASSFSMTEKYI
jgi:hypothetical protein